MRFQLYNNHKGFYKSKVRGLTPHYLKQSFLLAILNIPNSEKQQMKQKSTGTF